MTLFLDTNVLVDILRDRRPQYYERMNAARAAGESIRISSVCLHELMYGASLSRRPDRHLKMIEELMSDIEVDSWTAEDALVAARLRAQLTGIGQPIGAFDTLIAAHALRCEAVLVTHNLRNFFRPGSLLDDLQLVDWTISDRPLDRPSLVASLRRPQED